MNAIIELLQKVIMLPDTEAEKFAAIATERRIDKNEYFITEGQIPKKLAFVGKGLFRYFYIDGNGTEYTKNFILDGNFITAYSAMIAQKPSAMFIEALEDSVVYEINYTDWELLKAGHYCWKDLLIYFLEKAFSAKEKRERELLLLDAEHRYLIFKEEFPGLETRVKQHLIASYLGISPVSLSRLKNKKR
jgi:CRP-like cAMP-binding protein